MEDKPISIRLGARRMEALERYLAENPGETRNGVIAGAVEDYLKETGYWADASVNKVSDDTSDFAAKRLTLSERVKVLEDIIEQLKKSVAPLD